MTHELKTCELGGSDLHTYSQDLGKQEPRNWPDIHVGICPSVAPGSHTEIGENTHGHSSKNACLLVSLKC